ncbi:hypothetical protein J437_LFUL015950, partial [Ladona fulva]
MPSNAPFHSHESSDAYSCVCCGHCILLHHSGVSGQRPCVEQIYGNKCRRMSRELVLQPSVLSGSVVVLGSGHAAVPTLASDRVSPVEVAKEGCCSDGSLRRYLYRSALCFNLRKQIPGNSVLNRYMQYIYMATHNRMSPYLVGLALGCVLHRLRGVKVNLGKMVVAGGWIASMATIYGVIFGPYHMFQYHHAYNLLEASVFGGFHRFAWAVAVGWLIFACSKGYGGFINRLLSSNFFKPLSRLSYCMFLTHFAVLIYGTSRLRTAIFVDEYILLHGYAGDIFVTLIVSIFLHMCFEAPFLTLVRLFFGK